MQMGHIGKGPDVFTKPHNFPNFWPAYGCDVEAVELLKDGRPVPTRYQPQRSDSVVQSVAGGYTTVRHTAARNRLHQGAVCR